MRHLTIFLLLYLTTQLSFSQPINFTLKGRINKDSKAEILILQGAGLDVKIPLSPAREFMYKGSIPEADELFIKTDNSYAWTIWVASGDIDVTLQEWESGTPDPEGKKFLKITAITGPAETEKFHWFATQREVIRKQHPTKTLAQYNDTMAKYFDPLLEYYIREHPNTRFSAHISNLAANKESQAKLLSLVKQELAIENTQHLNNAIEREKITQPGATVDNFEMNRLNGQPFSLSALSSKYTLLDFWASWCGPCRHQHPALINTYTKFREKGFEIVAISLDDSKSKWKKAVREDKLPWIQVSELKGWRSSLANRFYIDAIPFNLLLDENKRIIASNLAPHALAEKLNELLNK